MWGAYVVARWKQVSYLAAQHHGSPSLRPRTGRVPKSRCYGNVGTCPCTSQCSVALLL